MANHRIYPLDHALNMNRRYWSIVGLALGVVLLLAAVAVTRPGFLRTTLVIPSPSATTPADPASVGPVPGATCDEIYVQCIDQCRAAGSDEVSCTSSCESILY